MGNVVCRQKNNYKYFNSIAKLSKEKILLLLVSEITTSPPYTEKYKTIKECLIRMRTLKNQNIGDETIQLLWMRLTAFSYYSPRGHGKHRHRQVEPDCRQNIKNSKITEVSAMNGSKADESAMTCILAQLAKTQFELSAFQRYHKNYQRDPCYLNHQHFSFVCFYHNNFSNY